MGLLRLAPISCARRLDRIQEYVRFLVTTLIARKGHDPDRETSTMSVLAKRKNLAVPARSPKSAMISPPSRRSRLGYSRRKSAEKHPTIKTSVTKANADMMSPEARKPRASNT